MSKTTTTNGVAAKATSAVALSPASEPIEHRQWSGTPALESLLIPIDSIHRDPANVRKHPERNLSTIRASLARFGQQRPLLIDASGIIRAGNGTHEAAESLGWTHIAVVRSDLKGSEATAYAVTDNRSAEMGAWDDSALAQTLRALQSEDFDLDAVGYTGDEVDALLESLASDEAGGLGGQGEGDTQGSPQEARKSLADRFGVPPFSVLDARQGYWQDRKRAWLALGIQSELGRGGDLMDFAGPMARKDNYPDPTRPDPKVTRSTYGDRDWIKSKGLSGLAQDAHIKPRTPAPPDRLAPR